MRSVLGMMVAALVWTTDAPGAALDRSLSCEGACGDYVYAPNDDYCGCEAPCVDRGHCCSDFEEHCPLTAAVGETCPWNGAAGSSCESLGEVASCADDPEAGYCTKGLSNALEHCAENPDSCTGPFTDCAEDPDACTEDEVSFVEYCAENPEACLGL